MTQKITAWSFSRFKCYDQCPAKAKYKFIDKLPEPGNAAMQRGSDIAQKADDFISGKLKALPKELALFKDQFKELKSSKPKAEEMWCFTKDWRETVWDDWNNIWARIKTDAHCLDENDLYVIDDKTGKQYPDHADQLSLYALGGMLKYPHVKRVITQLWYLDSGVLVSKEYAATEMEDLRKGWEKKVKPMLNDTRFPPKPGNHCGWCHFSKKKGGPCKF